MVTLAMGLHAQPAENIFRTDRVFVINLRITEAQWQTMQPTRASRLAMVLGVNQHPTTRPTAPAGVMEADEYLEGDRLKPSSHGYEYACVRAAVDIDGEKHADVGLRFGGNGSYGLTATSLKRPLHLDFDRFLPDQRYHGHKSLYLRNNAIDPSELCETLSMELFREIGVPAPLTSLAVVYLTVDGRYDREFLGIYTAIEQIDKHFLDQHFGTHKGLLIKPETTRSWAYFGNDWDEYARYGIKSEGSPLARQNFIELTRAINRDDDSAFHNTLTTLVDVDEFVRYLALNVAMVNTDSFIQVGHNFYLYAHPTTGRISIIPWDMNYSFGSGGRTMAEWTSLSIRTPYRSGNRFAERLFADPAIMATYDDHLRKLCAGPFSPARMHERIEHMEQVVRRAKEASAANGRPHATTLPASVRWERPNLKEFVTARVQNILEQLATETKRAAATPAAVVVPPLPAVPATRSAVVRATPPLPATRPAPSPTRVERRLQAVARPALGATTTPMPTSRPAALAVPARTPERPLRRAFLQPHPLAQPLMQSIDANRDGQLSREECLDSIHHFLLAHQRYSTGPVTAASMAATLDRLAVLVDPFPASLQDPPAARPTPGAQQWADAIMKFADANGDGQLAADELLTAAGSLFRDADANNDAILTVRELSQLLDRVVPRP